MPKRYSAATQTEISFLAVVDIASDAILAVDENENIIYFNRGAEKIFGYNSPEIIGKPLTILLPPLATIPHCSHILAFQSTPETVHLSEQRELTGSRKDGTIFPVLASIAKTINQDGKTIFTAILRDVSANNRTEEDFQKLNRKNEKALQIAQMGFWEFDISTMQFTFNDQYYSLHGTTVEEAGGYQMSAERFGRRYVPQAEFHLVFECVRLAINTGDPNWHYDTQTRILKVDGELRDIHIWFWIDKNTDGHTIKLYGVIQDITVSRRSAAELVIANQELLFQNAEKEKRAAELVIANQELLFQNAEKEKRAAELVVANQETLHSLKNTQALHKIDTAINSSLSLKLVLDVLLEQTTTQLEMDAACVLILNPYTQTLTYAAGRGFRTRAIEETRIRLSEEFSSPILVEGNMVYLEDPEQSPDFARAALLEAEGFVDHYAVTLFAKGHNIGLLEVFHRTACEVDNEWRSFLETLAGQAAIAMDNAQLFQNLQHSNTNLIIAYDATIEGWSHALDLRDKETEGHTQRVTALTERMARAMGIGEAELVHIRRGALLHDIGKMGVPDAILLKPDKLSADEWKIMRLHPQFALEMLSPIAYLRPALDIPYCHHEKWDGSGYPRNLKGEQIPISARLFAIIDVWDALRSDRPYRPGWPQAKMIEHIKSLSGTHFDPKVLELFLQVVDEDKRGVE